MSFANEYSGPKAKYWWKRNGQLSDFYLENSQDNNYFYLLDDSVSTIDASTSLSDVNAQVAKGVRLARAAKRATLTLLWKTKSKDRFDCVVECRVDCSIDSSDVAYKTFFSSELFYSGNVEESVLEARLIDDVKSKVLDELVNHTLVDLQNGIAIRPQFYELNLKPSASKFGLNLSNFVVSYSSAVAERQAEMDKLNEIRSWELQSISNEGEHKARKLRIESDYRTYVAKTRADASISEMDQQARIDSRRREIDAEKAQAEQDAELAALRFEKERLELQAQIDALRGRQDDKTRNNALLQQIATTVDSMSEARQAQFATIGAYVDDLKNQSGQSFHLTLEQFLTQLDPAYSQKSCRQALEATTELKFPVELHALRTRGVSIPRREDAKVTHYEQKVVSLAIDDPFEFQFTAPIDGYLTLLNLGTNGDYLLMAPNVEKRATKLRRGELFRTADLFDFGLLEGGPVGCEEILAIVSPEPLFRNADLTDDPDELCTELERERVLRAVDDLRRFDRKSVAVGTLSFAVVDK